MGKGLEMDSLTTFVHKPITQPMDFQSVILTTVLVVTVGFLWTRVLNHITE